MAFTALSRSFRAALIVSLLATVLSMIISGIVCIGYFWKPGHDRVSQKDPLKHPPLLANDSSWAFKDDQQRNVLGWSPEYSANPVSANVA